MKVFSFGDFHFPFSRVAQINKGIRIIQKEKPDVIIQMGDLNDQYMFGRFDKNLNVVMPKKELEKARKMSVDFWKKIREAAPKAQCYQLLGNHDVRIIKQTMKKFPEVYHLIQESHDDLYKFDGVISSTTDRDYLEIDDVIYTHGWQASHLRHFKKSVVRAHDHQAWLRLVGNQVDAFGGIKYMDSVLIARNDCTMFEISAGMFGDESKVPYFYTNCKKTNWNPAITIITPEYARLEIL